MDRRVASQSTPNGDSTSQQQNTNTSTQSSSASGSKTSIHVTALDGISTVNSLFTMAIFIGFSLTVPENATTENRLSCRPGVDTVRKLIVYEVISFSFFLFSSLIAQGLKLAINMLNSYSLNNPNTAEISCLVLRSGMLSSAVGSVLGCLFLMLSVVNFVQVKLGKLSCGGQQVAAVVPLIVLVSSAIVVFMYSALHALMQNMW